MPTATIKVNSPLQRILLIAFGLFCVIFVFFAAKWFFGNSVSTRVFQKEIAEFAIGLAPKDPQTHFAAGALYEQSFQPEDFSKSLAEYEKAVSLSPNDYRLWVAYGRAKQRNGDSAGAEKALLKALELAPNYAEVHWVYGNILLRQGKTAEAFAAIRRAVEGDTKFANPAASIAWDIFEGDLNAVKKNIGNSTPVQSALAVYLVSQKHFDEALEIWNSLPTAERKTKFREDGEKLFNELITNKKYRSALAVKSQIAKDDAKKISVGTITDGSFEGVINVDKTEVFEWEIAKGNQPNIGVSLEQKRSGAKSLAFVFNSPVGKDFRTVSQIVAVESGQKYEFQAFYKSDLETSATVKWEIADAESGKILATTNAIEQKADWKSVSASFTTSDDIEGVIIRLIRETCISADCSISGSVWFDEISLKQN